MARRQIGDEDIAAELSRWHDWLVRVEGETAWGETALEVFRRIVPQFLFAIEASNEKAVNELIKPPQAQRPEP